MTEKKNAELEANRLYPYMTDSPSGAISSVKYNEHQDTARYVYIKARLQSLSEINSLKEKLERAKDGLLLMIRATDCCKEDSMINDLRVSMKKIISDLNQNK